MYASLARVRQARHYEPKQDDGCADQRFPSLQNPKPSGEYWPTRFSILYVGTLTGLPAIDDIDITSQAQTCLT